MRRLSTFVRAAAVIAAILAAVATISAAVMLPVASSAAFVAELWRVVGLGTWTAIFVLLAARPTATALWAIACASKVTLVVAGLAFSAAPGAADLVLWDGLLAGVLAGGLALSMADRRHRRARREVDDRPARS